MTMGDDAGAIDAEAVRVDRSGGCSGGAVAVGADGGRWSCCQCNMGHDLGEAT